MTNLFNILLEPIDKQLELNDPPELGQMLKRLIDEGYTEEEAKELLCENLNLELMSIVNHGVPQNKERYINNILNLPMLNYDVESAFRVIDRTRWGIPFNAIDFLYNHSQDEKISEKIISSLENAYNENYIYDSVYEQYLHFPLWYAILAENHLSVELIDPVIKLFTSTEDDWDFLNEQGQFLLVKLAEKYPDITVEKVISAVENEVEKSSQSPYLFLFDTFYYADKEKYKNRLLSILQSPNLYWDDSFVNLIAHLQIKEAVPVIENMLKQYSNVSKDGFHDVHHKMELEHALEQLVNGKIKYPQFSKPHFQNREHWKNYYRKFDEKGYFNEDTETEDNNYDDENRDEEEKEIIFTKIQRNAPCPCGSGKKYKKCCLSKDNLSITKDAMRIPEEIQKKVKDIVKIFNQNEISTPDVYYIPYFEGKYLFMNRFEHGDKSPVFRLTFTGDITDWKFAIFHWSSETYNEDELYIVPGIQQFNGTIESAMKVGMEAYPV